jgi:hypothetical protein
LSWNSTRFGQFLCPSSGTGPWSCATAVYKPVWHIPLLSVQWINSWWWTYDLSETCRVSWQNKFVKLVHLVCFITKRNSVGFHGVLLREYVIFTLTFEYTTPQNAIDILEVMRYAFNIMWYRYSKYRTRLGPPKFVFP